jgi:hypothetical protein
MQIGIIGTGTVGSALAAGLSAADHDVVVGSRDPERNQLDTTEVDTQRAAAEHGDVVVLAVPACVVTDVAAAVGDALMTGTTQTESPFHSDTTCPDRSSLARHHRQHSPTRLTILLGTVLFGTVGWQFFSTHLWISLAETDRSRVALEPIEALQMIGLPILLIDHGYEPSSNDIPRDWQWLIRQWILIGLVSVGGIIAALTIHHLVFVFPPRNTLVEMDLLSGAVVGTLSGFAVRYNRDTSELRVRTPTKQSHTCLFSSGLLRHHISNSLQLIDGYIAQLAEYDDPAGHRLHEFVEEWSLEVASRGQNIRVIVHTFTDRISLEAGDLPSIVAFDCDTDRLVSEDAKIEIELPELTYNQSNERLSIVIWTWMDTAIQRYDQAAPQLRMAVEDNENIAQLAISDPGPCISVRETNQFLEPGETDGCRTGLSLNNRVVTLQRCQLRIEGDYPHGTAVTIELPKPPARNHPRSTEFRSDRT